MKVTPKFMNAMGSGADPNDVKCMKGFNLYMRYLDEYPSLNYSDVYAFLKAKIEYGEVENSLGKAFLVWARRLRNRPEAIRLGQDGVDLAIWRFKDQEFATLEQAQAAKAQIETDIRTKPFEHVNVLRHIKTPQGSTTASIKAWEQIRSDAKITVFDPKTGRHNEPADVAAEVERVLQQHLAVAIAEPIFRKIRDTQEGFEAWEPVK